MKNKNQKLNILVLFKSKHFSLTLIRYLFNFSYNVNIYAISCNNSIVRWSRYISGLEVIDFLKMQKDSIKKINTYCKKKNIDLIIPADVESSLFLSNFKKYFKVNIFPVPDTRTLKRVNNKWLLNKILIKLNLPFPKTILIRRIKDLNRVKDFPVIVKPLELEAGKQVEKIISKDQLLIARSDKKFFPFIAQEYIPGGDIDLSILARKGKIIAWTIQIPYKGKGLRFIEDKSILEMGARIISDLGYDGLVHFDMRRDQDSGLVKIIEGNPRVWGTMYASFVAGIDFIGIAINSLHEKTLPRISKNEVEYKFPMRVLWELIFKNRGSKISSLNKKELKTIVLDPANLFIVSSITLKNYLNGAFLKYIR